MSARDVVIYTTDYCPYCHAAKALLNRKCVAYNEVPIDGDRAARQRMSNLAGGRTTVPQVFIGDRHVGGSDDLHALERSGMLDTLLHSLAE